MARQTREERRKRRAHADSSGSGGDRTPPRPVRLTPEPAPDGPVAGAAHVAPRGGNIVVRFFRFVGESVAELRKVEWPRQHQVIQGTVVVLIACLVVGFYLWGADQVFKRLVENVLLR